MSTSCRILEIRHAALEVRADAPEHSDRESCEDTTDDDGLRTLHGASTLVRMFGIGWLHTSIFTQLYDASQKTKVRVDQTILDQIDSFRKAFLKLGGKDDAAWNASLNDNLSQIKQIRMQFADEFQPLTDDETADCLWNWARTYLFSPEQKSMPKSKQRSILNKVLLRELGSKHRLLAVIQRGIMDFTDYEDSTELLRTFISYVVQIEISATAIKQHGRNNGGYQRLATTMHQRGAPKHVPRHSYSVRPIAHAMSQYASAPRLQATDTRLRNNSAEAPERSRRDRDRCRRDQPMAKRCRGSSANLAALSTQRQPLIPAWHGRRSRTTSKAHSGKGKHDKGAAREDPVPTIAVAALDKPRPSASRTFSDR